MRTGAATARLRLLADHGGARGPPAHVAQARGAEPALDLVEVVLPHHRGREGVVRVEARPVADEAARRGLAVVPAVVALALLGEVAHGEREAQRLADHGQPA